MSEADASFRPGAADYGRLTRGGYATGRALEPQAIRLWESAVRGCLGGMSGAHLLDLGCGTGRFSGLLARWTDARVIGIDPSDTMLRAARRHERVSYVIGRAEAIPLDNASCDAAWLSQVVHHVADRRNCAAELSRVLRRGARVLVRGNFAGRLDGIAMFRYFPGARRIAETFPTRDETVEVFGDQGLSLLSASEVNQVTCVGLAALAARTRLRADTTLVLLATEEFRAGQAALERAAAEETTPAPVTDRLDVLVFEVS